MALDAREWGDEIRFYGVVPGPDANVDEARLLEIVEEYGLPYPQLRDRTLALTERFEVKGTPTILVLGPDGRLLYRDNVPPEDWSHVANVR